MPQNLIRPEEPRDVDGIREVNVAAFRDHLISQQTEHLIVDALRDAGALEISLIALREGQVVGHIAFSEAVIGDSDPGWFLLGPVAVLPRFQGEGFGSALVESGIGELRARGANGCVLVGDPAFYGRFGFETFPELVYAGVPNEYVLALPLAGLIPRGSIQAHEAFEIDPE